MNKRRKCDRTKRVPLCYIWHLVPLFFSGLNVDNNSASLHFGVPYHLIFEGEHFRSLVCIYPQLPTTEGKSYPQSQVH